MRAKKLLVWLLAGIFASYSLFEVANAANSTTVKDLHLYFVDGNETKHYTIMDRNMGASDINQGGYYYQWGNNYGFTYPLSNTTGNQVPYEVWGSYENAPFTYESSTFVLNGSNWQAGNQDQKFNSNLWGGKDDESFKNGTGTAEDRQGPCATGYYVPSAYDFNLILNAWTGSYPNYDDSNHNAFYDKFASDLLLTLDGKMSNSNGSIDSSGQGHYWTSSPANGANWKPTDPDYTSNQSSNLSRRVTIHAGQFSVGHLNRSAGMHVRCFKDDFKPEGTTGPLTIHLGSGQKTVIAVDGSGVIQTLNDALDPSGSGFKGWYTTENFLNGTKVKTGNTLSGTDLYARWEGQEESFVVTFKNYDGTVLQTGAVVSGSVLSGGYYTGAEPTKPFTAQTGYYFTGWNPDFEAITGETTYTAKFEERVNKYTVTIVSNDTNSGSVSTGTITVPYGTSIDTGSSILKIGTETSTATESIDTDQYDFSFVDWTNNCGTTVTTGCTITANFKSEVKKYEIIWKDGNGKTIQTGMVAYGDTPSYIGATPRKTATAQYTYTFNNTWNPVIKSVTTGATYIAQFSSTSVNVGGQSGRGGLKKDSCPNGDYSDYYYDGKCETVLSSGVNVNESEGFSQEFLDAYNRAYKNGITTMPTIKEANMDGYIIRSHLAKMMSQFAINVVGAKPNIGKEGCDKFNDIAAETDELKGYMKTACELGLMGLHADGKTVKDNFDPNDYVTRAEFGTVLSRFLYLDENNLTTQEIQEGAEWYSKHLSALKLNGIMTQIDGQRITSKELRGYVMLMLMRSAQI